MHHKFYEWLNDLAVLVATANLGASHDTLEAAIHHEVLKNQIVELTTSGITVTPVQLNNAIVKAKKLGSAMVQHKRWRFGIMPLTCL